MKQLLQFTLYSTICTMFCINGLFGQSSIPNPGFENWSGNTPVSWSAATNIPGVGEPVTKSSDVYSGLFAARGEVLSIGGSSLVPVLYTGTLTNPTFPDSIRHQTFSGYYKFEGQDDDILSIQVALGDNSTSEGAEGFAEISAVAASYTYVEINLDYGATPSNWQPDYGNVTITIKPSAGQQNTHPGSYFFVDHFTFDGLPLGLNEIDNSQTPSRFKLEQNYPNPFNPATNIKFSVPEESFVTLKIYDLLGNETAVIVNKRLRAGNYAVDWNAEGLPSGVYIYTLQGGKTSLNRKMILLK